MVTKDKAVAAKSLDSDNPIDSREFIDLKQFTNPKHYPARHKVKFDDICALGKTQFEAWERSILDNETPCKGDIELRRRAYDLVEKGRRLKREDKPEMSWRLELEPLVFKRFSSDVHCRICDNRIWFPRQTSPEAVKPPCQCDVNNPDGGIPGVDEIFDIRAEYCVNVSDSQKAIYERPDNVIGLRQTGKLYKLLRALDVRDEFQQLSLWRSLEPTLSFKGPHPVVYPFLVAEAKSYHAKGTIDDNFKQISKVIGMSLKIQAKLYDALDEGTWEEGPLVWAIVNRGPIWAVAAAYPYRIEGKCTTTSNPCMCLWEGSILRDDEAIQLLLIMDYIYEWARGSHRPAMIKGLDLLAQKSENDLERLSYLPSIAAFTVGSQHLVKGLDGVAAAMLSKGSNIGPENNADSPAGCESPHELSSVPHIPDSTYAVFREADKMNSRFLSVLITMDFLEDMRRCEPPDSTSGILFALDQILYNAAHCIDGQYFFQKRSHFNDAEDEWTKVQRSPPDGEDPQEVFLILPTFTAYFGADWSLTRELSLVGISIPVVQELLAERLQRMLGIGDEMPRARLGPFMDMIQGFRGTGPRAMVAACINGSCIVPSKLVQSSLSSGDEKPKYQMRESNGKWRAFAWSIHRARLDFEALGNYIQDSVDEKEPKRPSLQHTDSSPWAETSIITPGTHMVLIYSPPADPFREVLGPADAAMYCLYSLRQDTRALLEDLKYGRTAFPDECLNTERMTVDMKKSMKWNRMHKSKWSEGLMSQIGQQYLRVLQRSMWKSVDM